MCKVAAGMMVESRGGGVISLFKDFPLLLE